MAFFVLLAAAFALRSMLVLTIRRGRFGRRLSAMRDSPAAATMLGMNIPITKLAVFTVSAGMAGFAGALYGGLGGSAGPDQFQAFFSLPILLLAVVGGITTPTGALIGGVLYAMSNLVSANLQGASYIATGGVAILLASYPNGLASLLYDSIGRFTIWRR